MADSDKDSGKSSKSDSVPPPSKGQRFLKFVFVMAALAILVLGLLAYVSFEPQGLSDIKGYREEPSPIPPGGRDLAAELREASKSGAALRITEEEINNYLIRTLKFEQEGVFKGRVTPLGVWVRLNEGEAEVIIERDLMGKRRHTISMFLRPEQVEEKDGLATTVHRGSGQWGKVRISRGFMYLTKSSFTELGKVYSEELDVLKKMFTNKVRITITDDYIDLSAPKSARAPSN